MQFELHPRQTQCFLSEATEILYGGAAGGGKMESINNLIPTPHGFSKIGDLVVGNKVFNSEGKITEVVEVHPINYNPNCYSVVFNTGEAIDCDANHLWVTKSDKERERGYVYKEASRGSIRTTKEILDTLKAKHGKSERFNHSIDVCGAIDLPDATLPIHPYLLGLWIGDGHIHTAKIGMMEADINCIQSSFDLKIISKRYDKRRLTPYVEIRSEGLKEALAGLGILSDKRIPVDYLRGSIEQRKELLRGIMDTDGSCDKRGQLELGLSKRDLLEDVHELVSSLGIIATIRTKELNKKNPNHNDSHRIKFVASFPVFKLKRKLERQKLSGLRPTTQRRYIIDVKPIEAIPMRCITVACRSGTYLTGKSFIPTHNSHTMRVIAIYYALSIPNIQIYLFRRLSEDLKKNHLDGASGFNVLLAEYVAAGLVKINYSTSQIVFSNGSKINLCHCQHDKDALKYQGVEINLLLIDELTHFSEYIYKFLRSRVRLGSLKVGKEFEGKLPKIIASSNPGGVGHQFVKTYFIEGKEPFKIYQQEPIEGGMKRQFIPAKLADNPTMLENDPFYSDKLSGLGGALAKAMLNGDWDAIDGAYFDKFDKNKHVIEPFEIPAQWYRFRAFDYGYSAPFSVGWYAVSEGKEVNGQWIPNGALIKYREFYGTTGKANEGLRLENNQLAAEILRLQSDEKIRDSVADPAIFAHNGGVSIAEQFQRCGVDFRRADNERVAGWQQVRYRLAGEDRPMLYFFKTCIHTIKQFAVIQHDKGKPEDLDTDMEDHACFAAETLVDTDKGLVRIKDLDPALYKVMAGNEWTSDYFPALTRKRAKTVKLTFENGVEIVCTPDHKILDSSDEWRYAKDFLNMEAQCNQQLSVSKFVRCLNIEDWKKQPVYCLTEPRTNTFTVEGGLIVHNCDETRYGCMSRPLTIKHFDPIVREDGKIYVDEQTKIMKNLIKRSNDTRL